MIGQTILHYKTLAKLGEGGMGVVYKARDTKLDREVAIKFLPRHIAANAEERQRFEIEAKAAAALNHPNIATIYAIEEHDDEMFIVMEYIEGRELGDLINIPLNPPSKGDLKSSPREAAPSYPPFEGGQGDVLPIDTVLTYATQITSGLQAAHAKGVIHRDIKSSNIMVTESGQVKIMDFGLAKVAGTNVQLTKAHTTLGTAAYMSPEQARGEPVDQRTDIWAFGIVLYEMLTGQLPFRGEYEQAVVYSILNEAPQPVSEIRDDVPPALEAIVAKALAKDADKRYQNADELLGNLQSLQKSEAAEQAVPFSFAKFIRQPRFALSAVLAVLIIGFLAVWLFSRNSKADWARQQAIPEIMRLLEEEKYLDAWHLARDAEQAIPDDPLLAQLWPQMTHTVSIITTPSGASISIIDYENHTDSWIRLGISPLDSIRLPRGFFRWRIEKPGFVTLEVADASQAGTMEFVLDSVGTIPPGMARVASGRVTLPFAGLSQNESATIDAFLMDKFEVTNAQFKAFVDQGGYENPAFWQQPFMKNGKRLSFQEVMAGFRDATGRLGPATWELGTFPEGKENHPVAGVSWYEAAAYAEFAGKDLPTVYHWARAASHSASPWLLPQSNFGGAGVQPAGGRANPGYFGTYDMAGNVREWCWNETGGNRFILGGAWNDPAYIFSFASNLDPFDRSPENGFRCIKSVTTSPDLSKLNAALDPIAPRDYRTEKPVSDETFAMLKRLYGYDRTALNAETVSTDSVLSKYWIRTTVSIDAAYGNERMAIHLFLPKIGKPPFQTIILFPGANAFYRPSSERIEDLNSWDAVDFLPQSGRAVVYPVYKSMYERRDGYTLRTSTPNADREHFIFWRKDLGRTIDYLQTRADVDTGKLCYYGSSLGALVSPIFLALEDRIDLSINRLGGLAPWEILPEADPFNFISRVSLPMLILNGRYDYLLPYEPCQKPFYDLLGTPTAHKRLVLFDVTHQPPRPRNKAIKETLDWLDRYFGPAAR